MTPRELFETRRLEVYLAGTTAVFGVWLMMPFESMGSTAFELIRHAAPEWLWGLVFMFNGLSHMMALAINGRRWWSPFMRWFAALTSALVYAGFCAGFVFQQWSTTAVPIYSSLSVGCFICLWFAWRDARLSLEVRRHASHA